MTKASISQDKLTTITLDKGGHDNPDSGLCLMEAVAFVRGIPPHRPPAVRVARTRPVRAADASRAAGRRSGSALVPLIPALPGTAGDGHDEARGYMALDWLIRVYLPTWLELAGIGDQARQLRELGRIVDLVSAERAGPVVRTSRDKAAAAGDAAWAAARLGAGDGLLGAFEAAHQGIHDVGPDGFYRAKYVEKFGPRFMDHLDYVVVPAGEAPPREVYERNQALKRAAEVSS